MSPCRWLVALWIFGATGAYTFWLGFAAPALDSKEWSAPLLAVGLGVLGATPR